MSRTLYQPPKFAHKFKNQANLPNGAYNSSFEGLSHFASQDKRTKWCPNHPQRMIDDKYKVCYHCFKEGVKE